MEAALAAAIFGFFLGGMREGLPIEQNTLYQSKGWQNFIGVLHMDEGSELDNEDNDVRISSGDELAQSSGSLEISDDGSWKCKGVVRRRGQPAAHSGNSQKPVSSGDSDARTDPETCGECS